MATSTSCPKSVPGFATASASEGRVETGKLGVLALGTSFISGETRRGLRVPPTSVRALRACSSGVALIIACGGSGDFGQDGSLLDSSGNLTELGESLESAEAVAQSPELAQDELLIANRDLVDDLVRAISVYAEIAPDQQVQEASAVAGDSERDGDHRRQRVIRMTDEDKRHVLALMATAGIAAPRVSFSGKLVFIDGDTELELNAFAQNGSGASDVDKGKVLGQIVSTGAPPIAPVIYARMAGGSWLFNRPDLEHNVLLIPNAAPAFVFDDFVAAVAAVANASSGDCLGNGFMLVMRQATYDALPSAGRATLRTKTVAYEPGACPAGYSACAQFPVKQNVVISAATPSSEAVLRERFVTGRRIGIDSSQITSSSNASRATFVHELLHTLGIAHPKAEALGSGQDVTKLVVPGTLAGSCASAPCVPGTNYPSIMHQAMDLGRTNSLQPDDIDVISTLYASSGGCGYRAAGRVVVAQ